MVKDHDPYNKENLYFSKAVLMLIYLFTYMVAINLLTFVVR